MDAERATKQFCSDACRMRAYRKRKRLRLRWQKAPVRPPLSKHDPVPAWAFDAKAMIG
jgi:hypothetical protein